MHASCGARAGPARWLSPPTSSTATVAPSGACEGARCACEVGRPHTYRVAGIGARGTAGRRSKPVRVVRGHHAPRRPGRLRATGVTDSRVRLSWRAAARRSGRLAGYRIFRDGLPVRQVRGRTGVDRDLAPARRYRFTVAAVDTQGYMSASTAPAVVTTARPASSRGRAHAFLLASTGESFRDLQRHYTRIGTLYPTYFDCRASDGAITGRDDPLVTRWSQLRGILVLPRFNCQREDTVHRILTHESVRSATLSRLVALARDQATTGSTSTSRTVRRATGTRSRRSCRTSVCGSMPSASGCRSRFQRSTSTPRKDGPASTTTPHSDARRTTSS